MKTKFHGRLFAAFITVCMMFAAAFSTSAFAADRVLGDADGNGYVNASDASLILRYAVGSASLDSQSLAVSDVDGNGAVNASDAALILRRAVGLISSFPAESKAPTADKKSLVVYFTRSGNTERMANTIAEITGSDIYEIVPLNAYPNSYSDTTEVALAERDSNARPAIKGTLPALDNYDTIYVGYPIWWHTAPMIIGTFLESYDLSGIDIYPFAQSASMDESQFEESMQFVRSCAGNGNVHDGLFASPSDTSAIRSYLNAA